MQVYTKRRWRHNSAAAEETHFSLLHLCIFDADIIREHSDAQYLFGRLWYYYYRETLFARWIFEFSYSRYIRRQNHPRGKHEREETTNILYRYLVYASTYNMSCIVKRGCSESIKKENNNTYYNTPTYGFFKNCFPRLRALQPLIYVIIYVVVVIIIIYSYFAAAKPIKRTIHNAS